MILIGYCILLMQMLYIVNIFLLWIFEALWHMTIIIMLIFLNWFIICNKKWNMRSFFFSSKIYVQVLYLQNAPLTCTYVNILRPLWHIVYLKILNCQLYLNNYLVSCIDDVYIYMYHIVSCHFIVKIVYSIFTHVSHVQ